MAFSKKSFNTATLIAACVCVFLGIRNFVSGEFLYGIAPLVPAVALAWRAFHSPVTLKQGLATGFGGLLLAFPLTMFKAYTADIGLHDMKIFLVVATCVITIIGFLLLKYGLKICQWVVTKKDQNSYYSQKAGSLLQAVEILKKIETIPQFTYYTVDSPDGALGRDIHGYYTEATLKTKALIVESRREGSEAVEAVSLTGYGDMIANQTTVAHLKQNGKYSSLILLMKCGRCGYESPVETQPGPFVRECYSCGAENKVQRGTINVLLGGSKVEI